MASGAAIQKLRVTTNTDHWYLYDMWLSKQKTYAQCLNWQMLAGRLFWRMFCWLCEIMTETVVSNGER